jgi:hypothetical protein
LQFGCGFALALAGHGSSSRPVWPPHGLRPRRQTIHARLPEGHGRGQKLFEDISSLPRRQQEKVFEFVEAIVDQYRRKAS